MTKKGRRLKRFLGLRRKPGPFHRGGIEHLQPGRISGWVIAEGISLHDVRLLVGPHLIARAEINLPRPDVCAAFNWQGLPGFDLSLPSELPTLPSLEQPRLVAVSADGSRQVELRLMHKPKQTTALMQALLHSELLGIQGHFDGLQHGFLRGWAGRHAQQHTAQVWIQTDGQDPMPLRCDQRRGGMHSIGIPENSGFSLHPRDLPAGWAGKEVWCSFDRSGQFRIPQAERVILPTPEAVVVVENRLKSGQFNQWVSTSRSSSSPAHQEDVNGRLQELRPHWDALENYQLYLDKVEKLLDQRDHLKQSAVSQNSRRSWWQRLLNP